MDDKLIGKDEAEKILAKVKEDADLANVASMVVDNKITFEYKGVQYRVRMLNYKEKIELAEKQVEKYNSLLQKKDDAGNHVYLTETDLIKVYKERGIDLDKMDDEIKVLEVQRKALELKLGESLANKDSESILKEYKEQIETLKNQEAIYFIQKENLFRMSLNNQLLNYQSELITYLTLETQIEEKWIRKFNTYQEFLNCEDETLIDMAGARSMLLQYR